MENTEDKLAELLDLANYGLIWSPTDTSRSQYELRNGQQYFIGKFWKIGLKATAAGGRTHGAAVKLTRSGFLGRKIIVECDHPDVGTVVFQFTGLFGKGRIAFRGGRELIWTRGNVQGDRWAFVGTNGGMLVELVQLNRSNWLDGTGVNVAKIALNLPELPVMLLLGFYLILLMARNEHAISDDSQPFYSERVGQ